MKIKEVTDEHILFDNGNTITFDHEQDCYERNYADFSILTENNVNYNYDFDEKLIFSFVDGLGFVFGSKDERDNMRWIFIPCYSEQNGYYTNEISIFYNGKKVLRGYCEEHDY
jgi:hypothetical protein